MKGEPNKIPWSSSKQITCNGQQHDGLIIFCNISLWRKPLHHLLPQCFLFFFVFFGACWVMWGKLPVHSWLIDKNILPCQNVVLYWLQQNVFRLQILKTQGLFYVQILQLTSLIICFLEQQYFGWRFQLHFVLRFWHLLQIISLSFFYLLSITAQDISLPARQFVAVKPKSKGYISSICYSPNICSTQS